MPALPLQTSTPPTAHTAAPLPVHCCLHVGPCALLHVCCFQSLGLIQVLQAAYARTGSCASVDNILDGESPEGLAHVPLPHEPNTLYEKMHVCVGCSHMLWLAYEIGWHKHCGRCVRGARHARAVLLRKLEEC